MSDKNTQPIIKKIKKGGGHGHHGGAWKVAYADFVTAMMAFFLLMWLLNATSEEQKRGLSNYFGPPGSLQGAGGAGGVLGGTTIKSEGVYEDTQTQSNGSKDDESLEENVPAEEQNKSKEGDQQFPEQATNIKDVKPAKPVDSKKIKDTLKEYDAENFKDVKEALMQKILETPELKELAKSLIIDETPEGLRIQIVDQQKYSMFPKGEAKPLPHTIKLLELVTKVVQKLPNKISVTGHTDSTPYKNQDYGNWELSVDRANAARRYMMGFGLGEERVMRVTGKADTEPLKPATPDSEQNRRISILLHRSEKMASGADSATGRNEAGKAQEATKLPVTKPAPVKTAA